MTDTSTKAVDRIAGVLESKAARYGDGVSSFDSVTASTLRALLAERDELAAALDSEHASVGHNIWRFWSAKSRMYGEKNAALREALEGVVNWWPKDGSACRTGAPDAILAARAALEPKS